MEYKHITLLSNINNSKNNLHIEQTNYFKIGKFCVLMMYKLNTKWTVMQTVGQKGALALLLSTTLRGKFNSWTQAFKRVLELTCIGKEEGLKWLSNFILYIMYIKQAIYVYQARIKLEISSILSPHPTRIARHDLITPDTDAYHQDLLTFSHLLYDSSN